MNEELDIEGDNWECYLCGRDFEFQQPADGWLANYHMLCQLCADSIIVNPESVYYSRLTYHYFFGDIQSIDNVKIFVLTGKKNKNP